MTTLQVVAAPGLKNSGAVLATIVDGNVLGDGPTADDLRENPRVLEQVLNGRLPTYWLLREVTPE